jgi:hypothetical protein
MMTRKHFEAFAAMFREQMRFANDDTNGVLSQLISETADLFAKENSRFDRQRFLRAAGYYGVE